MLSYHEVSLQTVHHEDAAVAKSLLSKKLAIVSHYVTYVFGVMIELHRRVALQRFLVRESYRLSLPRVGSEITVGLIP